ncbi:unnamed protein product [Protopolystoma xenopodis]|uniref:Uncharacterized protein n=1 Tax=Protopolystoma xenopodis TaxID=117903 RepID=A0A3S5A6V1_9PLAT|nr:unnamed protein product [Protopolystoma xenopodis]
MTNPPLCGYEGHLDNSVAAIYEAASADITFCLDSSFLSPGRRPPISKQNRSVGLSIFEVRQLLLKGILVTTLISDPIVRVQE